ncbi:MAG TPA: hypothetical protein IAA58_05340 [Candidatus Gallacutalibacter stercoravium]|nr:hypothetical protein [Candidatus Gallacutalibacter stercoravium]
MPERKYRTAEERIAEIEKKIDYHQNAIAKLEKKKEFILAPKKRRGRVGLASVIKAAKENGMSVQEVAEKLGIEL